MKKILFLASLIFISCSGFSQWQKVNLGTTPNDGTGDPLRTAFVKVNHNDSLLFDTINLFIPWTDTLLNGRIYSRYFINAALLNKINWSDTLMSGKMKSKYQTDYLANFKNIIKYNDSTIIYYPNQSISSLAGSLAVGTGGKYLYHTTGLSGQQNTIIGVNAGSVFANGSGSTIIGYKAGNLTNANNNTIIGARAGEVSTGIGNNLIGQTAGLALTTGTTNTVNGQACLRATTTGSYNVVMGTSAAYYGNKNNSVLIGYQSGAGINGKGVNETNQIKLGYQSGMNDTLSNRLFIESSNSQTPLIGGKFDLDQLGVNKLITATWKATFNVGGSIDVTGAFYHSQLTGSLTDGTPTAAEINIITALTPATATAGYKIEILDSDGTGLIYDITSDGTNWQYLTRTKAL